MREHSAMTIDAARVNGSENRTPHVPTAPVEQNGGDGAAALTDPAPDTAHAECVSTPTAAPPTRSSWRWTMSVRAAREVFGKTMAASGARSSLPILQLARLRCAGRTAFLDTTDLTAWQTRALPGVGAVVAAPDTESASAAERDILFLSAIIPLREVMAALKGLRHSQDVQLTYDDGEHTFTVQAIGGMRSRFACTFAPDDFPTAPAERAAAPQEPASSSGNPAVTGPSGVAGFTGTLFTVPAAQVPELAAAVHTLARSAAKDDARPVFTGLLLRLGLDGQSGTSDQGSDDSAGPSPVLELATSDSYRIAIATPGTDQVRLHEDVRAWLTAPVQAAEHGMRPAAASDGQEHGEDAMALSLPPQPRPRQLSVLVPADYLDRAFAQLAPTGELIVSVERDMLRVRQTDRDIWLITLAGVYPNYRVVVGNTPPSLELVLSAEAVRTTLAALHKDTPFIGVHWACEHVRSGADLEPPYACLGEVATTVRLAAPPVSSSDATDVVAEQWIDIPAYARRRHEEAIHSMTLLLTAAYLVDVVRSAPAGAWLHLGIRHPSHAVWAFVGGRDDQFNSVLVKHILMPVLPRKGFTRHGGR